MLLDGRILSVLGRTWLPGTALQPLLGTGRTVQYFLFKPLELITTKESGHQVVSKINADLSGLILSGCIKDIANKYLCSFRVINILHMPLKGALLAFWMILINLFNINI